MPSQSAQGDHYVVCGLDGLGLRLVETLVEAHVSVAVVTGSTTPKLRAAVAALGVSVVDGPHDDPQCLTDAGVDRARAVAFVADDDSGNLRGALSVAKREASLRILIRLFNEALGERLRELFDECIILSEAAIASPFFAAAALGEEDGERIAIAGHALMVRRDPSGDLENLIPLVGTRNGESDLFPQKATPGGDVLVDLGVFEGGMQRHPLITHRKRAAVDRWWSTIGTLRHVVDHRLRAMFLVILVVVAATTIFFAVSKHLDPLSALYFCVVTLTTVGYGDINLQADPAYIKLVGIAYLLTGAALIAIFFSLLTDTVVGARIAEVLGGVRGRMRRHVIVCGLGDLGTKVALKLAELGTTVVAVEKHGDNGNVAAVRRAGIPVVVGDAMAAETLTAAQIGTASAVVVVTDDDVVDLQVAINARHLHPTVRIVVRLFDQELSTALEKRFGIHISRSSEVIAAPVFAEEMLREAIVARVNVGGSTLVFAEIDADDADGLVGKSVEDVENAGDLRVLAAGAPNDMTWRPSASTTVSSGARIAVVGRPAAIRALQNA